MQDGTAFIECRAFWGDFEHPPFVEQVPAPDGHAAVEFLAALEHRLDDTVAAVPEAHDISWKQILDGWLAGPWRGSIWIQVLLNRSVQSVKHGRGTGIVPLMFAD